MLHGRDRALDDTSTDAAVRITLVLLIIRFTSGGAQTINKYATGVADPWPLAAAGNTQSALDNQQLPSCTDYCAMGEGITGLSYSG